MSATMRIVQETITPERARKLLEEAASSVRQRRIIRNRVTRLEHAIRTGQWQVTHQGIALNPEGFLIDGQHRLTAIAQANTPVEMMVSYDTPDEVFHAIDTGAARTPGDSLTIAGYAQPNQLAAATRMLLAYDHAAGTKDQLTIHMPRLTTEDVIQLLATDRGKLIVGTLPDGSTIAGALGRWGLRTWMTTSLVIIREAGASPDLYHEFVERLKDGAMLPQNSPILSLRRYLMGEHGYWRVPQSYRATAGIVGMIKTWNAWINGAPLGIVRYQVGGETIPKAIVVPQDVQLDLEDAPVNETPFINADGVAVDEDPDASKKSAKKVAVS